MFSFVLFDPSYPDAVDRHRPPRLADVRGDIRPVVPPRRRRRG